jgi:two-component system heavy metal sensor histidine kinase CusS
MASRVTRGMAVVAALSALVLAAAAAGTAWLLWEADQRQQLRDDADSLAAAVEREVEDEHLSAAEAAPEALRESTVPGVRVEVWTAAGLVAATGTGPEIGREASAARDAAADWVVHRRTLREGLVLVVAAPANYGRRALRVFAVSLLVASPVCLLVALLVGRAVARRATRPLIDLQSRIGGVRALEPLPPAGEGDVPAEVADLEDAFRALWTRLEGTVRREREFAANASHELRMPLARIRLLGERARAGADPDGRAAIDAQVEEVDRLVRVVESLLVLARDTSAGIPRGEAVNLADVARRVTARVLDGSTGKCSFPDEAVVRGDEDLIEIAVQNLLENARKFAAGSQPVRVVLFDEGGRVRLEVTTPGAHIAAAQCERLFDRFYRAPEVRAQSDGHGLGLALARHVARLHGGDVSCVSAESEDARFALQLPAWSANPPPAG